jgi:hypothetical protein
MFFPAILFSVFSLFWCVFLLWVFSLCCYLSLASSMAVAWLSLFQICSRNSVCRLAYTDLYPLWRADEVSGEVVIENSLSYMLLLIPEEVCDCHCCSYCKCLFWFSVPVWFLFSGPLFSVLSILLWKFLLLNEEVLTWICFLLIVRMEISQFL